MMQYHDQIKHPNWQRKRLEVLELNNFRCQDCSDKETELHVHHPFYKRGAMIWDYAPGELMCLCAKCHKNAHAIDEKIKRHLAVLTHDQKKKIFKDIKKLTGSVQDKKIKEDPAEHQTELTMPQMLEKLMGHNDED